MRKIIIADAGGTSTNWVFIKGEQTEYFERDAFNATTSSANDLYNQFMDVFGSIDCPDQVFLYVAGLVHKSQREAIEAQFKKSKKIPYLSVMADTYGVARALFQSNIGYFGILGTGAGFYKYDGKEVLSKTPSLGFLLGDEGSGSYLGKSLLRCYHRGEIPKSLMNDLEREFSEKLTLNYIYQNAPSARYFSQFVPWIGENQEEPAIKSLIVNSFDDYFKAFVLRNTPEKVELRFCGSIAYFFKDLLQETANKHLLVISDIIRSPLENLVTYHKHNFEI